MTKFVLLPIAVLLFVLSTSALQERHKMPSPPEPMNPDNAQSSAEQATLPRHIDLVEVQRETDDQLLSSSRREVKRGAK